MIDTLTNDVPQHCRLQDILTPANHGNHGDTYVRRLSHSYNSQLTTLTIQPPRDNLTPPTFCPSYPHRAVGKRGLQDCKPGSFSTMNKDEVMRRLHELQGEDEEAGEHPTATVCGRPLTEKECAVQYTSEDMFEILRVVRDPEHPELSLGDLKVVRLSRINVDYDDALFKKATILIFITPTVPHCVAPTHISLCILERLGRYLPPETKWKIELRIYPGTHDDEEGINKKVNDKERICAAFENKDLFDQILKLTNDDICVL